ncbi:hypothetical protein AB6N23_18450, partial [Cellulomonas sp. 179-A 9B4 NHS]
MARLAATATDLAARAAAAADAWDRARHDCDAAVATAALLARRTTLRADLERLEDGRAAHEADVLRLAAARSAAAVRPLLLGAEDAATAWAGARKALLAVVDAAPVDLHPALAVHDALRGAVRTPTDVAADDAVPDDVLPDDVLPDDAVPDDALPDDALPVHVLQDHDLPDHVAPGDGFAGAGAADDDATAAWRALVADARVAAADEASALRRLVTLEEQLDGLRRAVRDAAAAIDDLRAEVATHDAWLAARPDARAGLVAERDTARTHGATCATCDARVATAEQALADVTALHDAVRAHERADAARAAAARDAHT